MDVTTQEGIARALRANDPVLERAVSGNEHEHRHLRILQLREAIESAEYCISSSDLADAILQSARRAN